MKILVLLLAFVFLGCTAPPIKDGKCLVDSYDGRSIEKQTCVYQGYVWTCYENDCTRGDEAVGERAK